MPFEPTAGFASLHKLIKGQGKLVCGSGASHCPIQDNFFVATPQPWFLDQQTLFAAELTSLFGKPSKLEGAGTLRRCLELWVSCLPGSPCRAVLGFRTDAGRQGESGDVVAWPPWEDPRSRTVLHGLLCGLVAKVTMYQVDGVLGFPPSVCSAVRFLRGLRYPEKAWQRLFGLALLRRGVPFALLPGPGSIGL